MRAVAVGGPRLGSAQRAPPYTGPVKPFRLNLPRRAPDPRVLPRLTAGPQDPEVDALTVEEVLWVRDRALGGRLIGPTIVLQLVEAYFEARGTRGP
jgi:hypothetical protein